MRAELTGVASTGQCVVSRIPFYLLPTTTMAGESRESLLIAGGPDTNPSFNYASPPIVTPKERQAVFEVSETKGSRTP